MQSMAWAGMAIRFSQEAPLAEALRKTFDGEHPCKVCKLVKEGRQAEQQQTLLKVETKLELCLAAAMSLPQAPAQVRVPPAGSILFQLRSEPPLTPPPRLA